ncbi:MAG: helix-turn-helix domain-containing protein [Novosphingobium sp.]|nr:helix-turn-helix domain-containing protein [Novosphingobium sp.]
MINLKRRKADRPASASFKSTIPPAIPMPVELMTVSQAAQFAQVSQPTIRRWIRCEGLAAYRSRGRVRIDKADVVQFLKGGTA